MRKTTAVLSTVAAIAALTTGVLAAPQGMAPYPGQTGAMATPPPPPDLQPNAGQTTNVRPVTAPKNQEVGCLWTRRISGWTPSGDRQMIMYQGRKRYLVTLNGSCYEQYRENAIRVSRQWGSCLSPGDSIEFTSPFGRRFPGSYLGSCVITKIELAPEKTAQR